MRSSINDFELTKTEYPMAIFLPEKYKTLTEGELAETFFEFCVEIPRSRIASEIYSIFPPNKISRANDRER
jgi:hypothetical protein